MARIAMPRSAVKFLEHSWVTRSYGGRGAALGVLAGVATGVAVLAIDARDCEDICVGYLLLAPYVVGGGAFIGGVVGWAIGRSVHQEEWRRVPLPRSVGLAPGYDGRLALRLTFSF